MVLCPQGLLLKKLNWTRFDTQAGRCSKPSFIPSQSHRPARQRQGMLRALLALRILQSFHSSLSLLFPIFWLCVFVWLFAFCCLAHSQSCFPPCWLRHSLSSYGKYLSSCLKYFYPFLSAVFYYLGLNSLMLRSTWHLSRYTIRLSFFPDAMCMEGQFKGVAS